MTRKNLPRLVSGLMLPWKKEKGVHRLDAPVYRFSYGLLGGDPLFSAVASTYVTDKGHELIVTVETWDRNGGLVSTQEDYVLRRDLREEELLALASEMTFEVISAFYEDLSHAAIAR